MSTPKTITKYGCLAFLTFQNSALVLTLRYSRTQPGPRYLTSTAVLLSEVFKCLISLAIYGVRKQWASRHNGKASSTMDEEESLTTKSFPPLIPTSEKELSTFLPILVPAFLYMIQNNLQFIAISNLDAATFQVAYQGKILTTALCAVLLLGKRLSRFQILSICLLTFGVACASVPPRTTSGLKAASSLSDQSHIRGMIAAGTACLLSGLAGVYTELILKGTQRHNSTGSVDTLTMLWYRNFQLALASILFALPGTFIIDKEAVFEHGFLFGYNKIVWITISQQVLGGLVVSLVLTYADNILKGFATSMSVVISTIASVVLWRSKLSTLFLVGMVAVLTATHIYGYTEYLTTSDARQVKQKLVKDVNDEVEKV